MAAGPLRILLGGDGAIQPDRREMYKAEAEGALSLRQVTKASRDRKEL
jgi:hypothetical protein